MFHWTDERIKGHVAMCFIAFTFINYLKNLTRLEYHQITRAIDKMQLSHIKDDKDDNTFYLRSKIEPNQQIIIDKTKIVVPKDTTPQHLINQYFMT